MRDYQPKVNNRYWLPRSLYRRTLALIRDYFRMVEDHDNIPEETSSGSQGGGSGTGDRTGSAAIRMERIAKDIDIIDRALKMIPEEYRPGVWASVQFYVPYPKDADKSTYSRYKGMFIYYVAKFEGWTW